MDFLLENKEKKCKKTWFAENGVVEGERGETRQIL